MTLELTRAKQFYIDPIKKLEELKVIEPRDAKTDKIIEILESMIRIGIIEKEGRLSIF